MDLGAFSVSLAVKDLADSKSFYEKLGFMPFHGDASQGWLIMKNGNTVIGLFQGMFEKNMLTFNPGWDSNARDVNPFTDVRDIQRMVKSLGLNPATEVDEASEGPGSMLLLDPDGNPILIDQHR